MAVTTEPKSYRPEFVKGPYRSVGHGVYADHPQPTPLGYRGFSEPEGEAGYLIAESIPHEPTRNLLAAAPYLYDFVASLENDDGSLPTWVWEWRNNLLAYVAGDLPFDPTPGSDAKHFCPDCPQRFFTARSLAQHQRDKHRVRHG